MDNIACQISIKEGFPFGEAAFLERNIIINTINRKSDYSKIVPVAML